MEDTMLVDWERLREEIKPMQDQLGREFIAFYSQYDPDSEQYTYSPHGLIFSDEAVSQADGESSLILFEVTNPVDKHLKKVILINAPVSELANEEMRIWTHGSGSSPPQENVRSSFMLNSVSGDPEEECDLVRYAWCSELGEIIVTPEEDWMDDPFYDHESSLSEEGDGGSLYPPQPTDPDCDVAYSCGSGGGGVGGVDGDDEDEFMGDITIDDSILDNPKAKCVLDRLLNDGNTLANTIVRFAEDDVNLNLHIELADLGPGTNCDVNGCVNGSLVGDGSTNAFRLQLNENRINNRTPIEIAATFLHESIHAEMRRYLDREGGNSTLPGFPGDFTDDWNLFLEIFYNKQFSGISNAEHEIMATKYRNIIIEGLKEFGDPSFSNNDYEAISWIGFQETDYYLSLSSSEKTAITNNIQSAKNKADENCN